MKLYLLVAAALVAAAPLAQAQTPSRNPADAPFIATRPASTTFNLTVDLEQIYRNGNWKDTIRTTNSRFGRPAVLPGGAVAPAQPARILREQSANGGAVWASVRRQHRLYNAANGVVNDTSYTFNATTGAATARFMSATTYNAAGNVAQMLSRSNFSAWQNSGRNTYTYDAQGRLTVVLLEITVGSNFFNSARELYVYNAQGQVTEVEEQQDNGLNTGWLPFSKSLYTYDAQGRVQTFVFQNTPTATSGYQNFLRDTHAYDAANGGRLQSVARDGWAGSAWLPTFFFTWSYDPDGNITFLTRQKRAGTTLLNNYRNAYTYQRILGTRPANALQAALVALPNPAAAGTAATLRYELPTAAPVTVQVLDVAGRVVAAVPTAAQAAGPHTLTLPAPAVPGLYLVRLSAGGQSQTVKLAVE